VRSERVNALETRLSLEVFQRHFIVTHLKDKAAGVLDELERRASQSGKSFGTLLAEYVKSHPDYTEEKHFQEDCWYAKEIPLDVCYFAHSDFREHPVPKDERFVDIMPTKREEIELDSFPYSFEIRAPWSETPMPEPLVCERNPGKYYILDGQLRVIRHWYHHIPNVKVFVYRGKLNV
jgi:hypothetical protein